MPPGFDAVDRLVRDSGDAIEGMAQFGEIVDCQAQQDDGNGNPYDGVYHGDDGKGPACSAQAPIIGASRGFHGPHYDSVEKEEKDGRDPDWYIGRQGTSKDHSCGQEGNEGANPQDRRSALQQGEDR